MFLTSCSPSQKLKNVAFPLISSKRRWQKWFDPQKRIASCTRISQRNGQWKWKHILGRQSSLHKASVFVFPESRPCTPSSTISISSISKEKIFLWHLLEE